MSAISKYLSLSLCAAIFFLAAAYLDLTLRARNAYLEGEKYMAWAKDPALKERAVENIFSARLETLERGRTGNSAPAEDIEDEKELLTAEKNFKKGESAAKYAYIWYRTAAEDFSPPATRWTVLARRKAPEALALWEAESGSGKSGE